MNHAEARQLFDDYLDGVLPASERDELERYLQANPDLQHELTGLRDLLERAASLPDSIEPDRDLWPGIAAAIPKRSVADSAALSEPAERGAPGRRQVVPGWIRRARDFVYGPGYLPRPAFAMAAVVILILFAAVTWRENGMAPSGLTDAEIVSKEFPQPAANDMVRALSAECGQAEREAVHFAPLPEDKEQQSILALITHNLRIIELAIADARKAWEADPESPHLARLLASAYRAKATLQKQETSVAAQM